MTNLDIAFDDNYMIQICHQNGSKGVLVVDVVSPVAVRKLEAYGEKAYLLWNGTPDSISEYNPDTGQLEAVMPKEAVEHKEGYRSFIVENAYRNEINAFFDSIFEDEAPPYGFEQDRQILEIIDSLGA